MATNNLESLKKHSIVVADTADFGLLAQYKPQDGTTNPSLVLAGTKIAKYSHLVDEAIAYAKKNAKKDATQDEILDLTVDKLTVNFGLEILKIIPGRVSSEVDAKFSFDADASFEKALRIVALYKEAGIGKERLYIKLAATWQGIQAAKRLEAQGINCNLTLLFSFAQAVACAQAKVALISPFVGRIMDWFKKSEGKDSYTSSEDPGVISVTKIYNYYRAYGYETTVMGASFRNTGEVTELAGCDKITISPQLLGQLEKQAGEIPQKLNSKESAAWCEKRNIAKQAELTESAFLFQHNEEAMAVEKLAEGIRNFNKDTRTLENSIRARLA